MVGDSNMIHDMESHAEMKAIDAFPNYHPLVVHFPIVLIIIATLFQLICLFAFKKEFGLVVLILLSLGVITAWLSSNTFHAHPAELNGSAKAIFETHEQMADLSFWISLIALISKIVGHYFLRGKLWLEIMILLLLFASTTTVAIAGHHGAMLVHMEGVGPKGKFLETHEHPNYNK